MNALDFIPPGYKKLINPGSGTLTGPLRDKTPNWLFHSDANYKYLFARTMLSIPPGARKNATIVEMIRERMIEYRLLDRELVGSANPIIILGINNENFLSRVVAVINDMWMQIYHPNVNPDTGVAENTPDYEYGPESYTDGTWHPEMLFTHSKRNREAGYWRPLDVSWDTSPEATGLGHRYNRNIYHGSKIPGQYEKYAEPLIQPGYLPVERKPRELAQELLLQNQFMDLRERNDKYFLDTYGSVPLNSQYPGRIPVTEPYGQFAPWRRAMQYRPVDRDPQGLRDAGTNDRRVSDSRPKYDLSDLFTIPHYGVNNNSYKPNSYSGQYINKLPNPNTSDSGGGGIYEFETNYRNQLTSDTPGSMRTTASNNPKSTPGATISDRIKTGKS